MCEESVTDGDREPTRNKLKADKDVLDRWRDRRGAFQARRAEGKHGIKRKIERDGGVKRTTVKKRKTYKEELFADDTVLPYDEYFDLYGDAL